MKLHLFPKALRDEAEQPMVDVATFEELLSRIEPPLLDPEGVLCDVRVREYCRTGEALVEIDGLGIWGYLSGAEVDALEPDEERAIGQIACPEPWVRR